MSPHFDQTGEISRLRVDEIFHEDLQETHVLFGGVLSFSFFTIGEWPKITPKEWMVNDGYIL